MDGSDARSGRSPRTLAPRRYGGSAPALVRGRSGTRPEPRPPPARDRSQARMTAAAGGQLPQASAPIRAPQRSVCSSPPGSDGGAFAPCRPPPPSPGVPQSQRDIDDTPDRLATNGPHRLARFPAPSSDRITLQVMPEHLLPPSPPRPALAILELPLRRPRNARRGGGRPAGERRATSLVLPMTNGSGGRRGHAARARVRRVNWTGCLGSTRSLSPTTQARDPPQPHGSTVQRSGLACALRASVRGNKDSVRAHSALVADPGKGTSPHRHARLPRQASDFAPNAGPRLPG